MACYHPLKAFPIGHTDKGKTAYKITSYHVDHVENHNGTWKCFETPFSTSLKSAQLLTPGYGKSNVLLRGSIKFNSKPFQCHSNHTIVSDFIEIPCGKCIGCRLAYSRQWADRMMLELPYHDSSYFITLTYDDAHLPFQDWTDMSTGEIGKSEIPSLVKKDMQDFMKRLRIQYKRYIESNNLDWNPEIRFYGCGEYGSKSLRPHFHIIVFGLHLDDLQFFKRTSQGFNLYNSPFLDSVWQYRGYVVVGDVSWDTCAYVARYVTKKLNGSASSIYDDIHIEPEFSLMSRKPGIANQYFKDHTDEVNHTNSIYESEFINLSTDKGGRKIHPPKYYDSLYDVLYPSDMQRIKNIRKDVAIALREQKLSSTSLPYLEMLASEEKVKMSRTKVLKRDDV